MTTSGFIAQQGLSQEAYERIQLLQNEPALLYNSSNRTTRMDNPHRTSYSDMLQSQYISINYTFHLLIRYLVKLVKFTLKYEGPSLGSTLIFLERWHYLIALTQFFQILISYGFKWKIIDCTGKSYVNNTGATYQVQYIMSSNFLFLESWGFPKF